MGDDHVASESCPGDTRSPEHPGRNQRSKLGYATRNANDENAHIKYERC